jgi:EpsI family protein
MKSQKIVVSVVMAALMLSASALSSHLTPTVKLADQGPRVDLAAMVPERFGQWRIDPQMVPLQVDPATQAKLDKIYNQTLSRTYVNDEGERVMLSMAYGGEQSDRLQVHKPEVCYGAQGFEVQNRGYAELPEGGGMLPVKRLYAVSGARQEPITYWITVGDRAIRPGLQQKLQQLRYGLGGTVPDGMLVRVSSISGDEQAAFALQQRFIAEMLQAVNAPARIRLAGNLAPPPL